VRQGQAGKTICYSDLAFELGMLSPHNLNFVLGPVWLAEPRVEDVGGFHSALSEITRKYGVLIAVTESIWIDNKSSA
jgi:hypothetical protein